MKIHLSNIALSVFVVGIGLGSAQEMPVSPEPGATNPATAFGASDDGTLSREIRLLPGAKRTLALKPDELNPYSRRTSEIEMADSDEEGDTESDRIRRLLTGLAVSGRGYGPKGIRVLAGDIIFERGKFVPQVLEDQTELLRVENVDESSVTLGWIDEETSEPTGKRMTLEYDLTPKVGYVLKGQPIGGESGESKGLKFGVMHSSSTGGNHENRAAAPASAPARRTAESHQNQIDSEIFKQGQ